MKKQLISVSLLAVLSACAQAPGAGVDTASIVPPSIGEGDNLRTGVAPPAGPGSVNIKVVDQSKGRAEGEVSKIRSGALQEAAQSYGSQMGYARRAWEIMGRLEARSGQLSTAFDFNRVVSAAPVKAGVVIPPVVSRSFNAFTIDGDGTEASVADEYLTI
ncbi:MAG: type IV secretory system conjugative DNA transfer family protein, partial [Roseibium sp.]|uniref:type IV secretory system conjugative DNA transfer family protein n=1 Tax=Roseibium sp. TaxID=1936156 RepID=UPI0032999A82